MNYKCINVEEAHQLITDSDAQVIDIRDSRSFEAGHIDDAQHISDANVNAFINSADLDKPLIVCCYHGNMSKGAAEFFSERGFKYAYSLNGGYMAWKSFQAG